MTERTVVRRVLGWLAGIVAAVLIVLAVLVGIARLLLPLAPDYQDEIRRFVSDATGFNVSFGSLSASWPLRGPEVRFADVRIALPADPRPVFDAREFAVGLNVWRLLLDRSLKPGTIAVTGARVRLEHRPDGQWLVNSVPLEALLRRPRRQQLPRLDVDLRDIDVLLLDPARLEPQVAVSVRRLELAIEPELIGFDGDFSGPDGLAEELELVGTVPAALLPARADAPAPELPPGLAWEVQATAVDLDLARLLRILVNEPVPVVAVRGDVELEAGFEGRSPRAAAVDLELGPMELDGVAQDAAYQRLQLQASWQATAAGWQAVLDRLAVERGGEAAPASTGTVSYTRPTRQAPGALSAAADMLRLEDLWPLVWSVASTGARRDLLPASIRGEISDLKLQAATAPGKPPTWQAEAAFRDLGLVMPAPGWAVTGATGTVRARESGGELTLDSGPALLRFPKLFRADIPATSAAGRFAWRPVQQGLEVTGDELRIATADGEGKGKVRVIFPPAGSVYMDVDARFVASSAPAALNYLPLVKFNPDAVKWLDRALVAGSVPGAELRWQGPVRGFPYETGDGLFRAEFSVADAVLDYADDWPRLENVAGTIVIDGASLVTGQNRGSIGGIPFTDAEIRIASLRQDPVLEVSATSGLQLGQILAFLRQTPVADSLGPALETATGSGGVTAGIDLRLPVRKPADYRLAGTFDLEGARLGLRGVDFGLTGLQGRVRLDTDRLVADKVSGRFLDEPVSIVLRPAGAADPGLTQIVALRGETPVGKLAAAFSLPYAAQLDGRVAWDATVQVPARRAGRPVSIAIASDLAGLESRLPPPLAKAAGSPEPLRMQVRLPERGRLEVSGDIERGVSWALQFVSAPRADTGTAAPGQPRPPPASGWRLERGDLRSGSPQARLPAEQGLVIGGNFATLRFEDWFPGTGGAAGQREGGPDGLIRQIDLRADRFAIVGHVFRDARIDGRRSGGEWRVDVRGPSAEGSVVVPLGGTTEAPLVLDLQRLWLVEPATDGGSGRADPRNLPPMKVTVADFVLSDLRLGRLTAELRQRGDGVLVEPLRTEAADFSVSGDASWVVEDDDVTRQRSELRLELRSTNIATTLAALGYDPVIEGAKAGVTLDLFWPGGPGNDFLNTAGGRVVLNLGKGQLLGVDPGSGRLLGLLSIAALPRRLGLDFSDVTDKGLAFDVVKGEFRLDKGNAFTCNLGLVGPVTDIAVLGRTSIPARSYDQLAVVRPHVSDALAVGGFVGGPLVGSTVLLMSQIFRKPLSSLGETYYRVSGGWAKPVVTKVQKSDVDLAPFRDCERYLAEALQELPPEAELTR